MKKTLLMICAGLLFMSLQKDIKAYRLFDKEGDKASFQKLIDSAVESDIILFGELHNNPINHWFEYELIKALYEVKKENLIVGAEMFETDNSVIIKEYLMGKVKDKNFEAEARLWPNYKTDYKPILEFVRDSNIRFIPTNIPRRYASLVNREGLESLEQLDSDAKKFIAPLPIKYDAELTGYKSMLSMMEGSGHANENLPKAQAIKDATMAHFILANYKEGETFFHFHGTYHSDDFQGILWYLNEYRPGLKVLTISSQEQDDIEDIEEDNKGKADFILITPSSMTKTH